MAIFQILLSVFFLYLSYPNIFNPFGYWVFAWIFAIPLYSLGNHSRPVRWWYGLLFGIFLYPVLLQWFIPYSFLGYLFYVCALSIQPLIFFGFLRYQPRNSVGNLFYIPSAWVAAEYLRTMALQGFSWNIAGTQTFNLYTLQVVALLGSSGLSFLLVFVSGCLYRTVIERNGKYVCCATMIILIVYVYGFCVLNGDSREKRNGETLKICTIQPNIDFRNEIGQQQVYALVDQQLKFTQQAVKENQCDLIIWPETAIPTDLLNDQLLKREVEVLAQGSKTHLLVGTVLTDERGDYNGAALFDSRGRLKGSYRKRLLAPFSEYLPWGKRGEWLSRIFNVRHNDFISGKKYEVFSFVPSFSAAQSQNRKFGVLICSEDTVGAAFKEYVKRQAEFVVVLLNDGWFSQKIALIMHAQNSILHAVENRIPVVRAANTGWSFAVDEYGRLLGGMPSRDISHLNTARFFIHQIAVHHQKPPAYFLGDTLCELCLGFVIMILIRTYLQKIKRRTP